MENLNYKNKNIEKKYLNTWYDWLIDYITEPIRKIIGGFKDKVVSLFNTNTPKQTAYERGKKLNKPKTQKKSEENIINNIRSLFTIKKKKKELNIE